MRVMSFKLLIILVLMYGLLSCVDRSPADHLVAPCDLSDIIFVNEGTLICSEANGEIYAGGQLHLIGKDKSVYKFYTLSKSEDNLSIENTYTYESDHYGYSKNTKYLFRDGYLVVEFTKLNNDIISYSIPLANNDFGEVIERLKLFERSVEGYVLEHELN